MQMQLDGPFGDIEFVSNRFVGEALGGEKRDLALAHAQTSKCEVSCTQFIASKVCISKSSIRFSGCKIRQV